MPDSIPNQNRETGCGDTGAIGSCYGKKGTWKLKYNIPTTRKIRYKQTEASDWTYLEFYSSGDCREIGWRLIPLISYLVTGTAVNILGQQVDWQCELGYCIASGDIRDGISLEIVSSDPNVSYALPELSYLARGSTFVFRYFSEPSYNGDTGEYIENIQTQQLVLTQYSSPMFLTNTLTYTDYDYPYEQGVPPDDRETNQVIFQGVESVEISEITQTSATLYRLDILGNGLFDNITYLYERPFSIEAIQDELLPETEEVIEYDETTRADLFNLDLSNIVDRFFFSTISFGVYLHNENGVPGARIIMQSLQGAISFLVSTFQLWLEDQVAIGDTVAPNILAEAENQINYLEFLLEGVFLGSLITLGELESPYCSQIHPLVCWECGSSGGCPPETCFKCYSTIDNLICCYGPGGKVLATVSVDEDTYDC
jgi:hypothetical protein